MDQSQRWLVANWKMHGTRAGAAQFATQLETALQTAPASLHLVFCPPASLLACVADAIGPDARLKLGGQDCHAAVSGAYTGSISASMLADAGAHFVILGHSERRAQCYEDCAQVRAKADAALAVGLTPILCVGETLEEYEAGKTADVLYTQCNAFAGLDVAQYLVAYEPVWAIGSGRTPTVGGISAAHSAIKSALGSGVRVLYGGSVKSTNIREILGGEGVCGALIGGASLELDSMRDMIDAASV